MSSLFGPVSAAIASLVFLPLPKHPMQPPPPQECVRSCAAELTFVPPPFWDFTLIVTNGTATESCVKCGGCSYTWIWEFDPAEVCRWSYQTPNHGATTYGGAGGAAGPYEGIDFMQRGFRVSCGDRVVDPARPDGSRSRS